MSFLSRFPTLPKVDLGQLQREAGYKVTGTQAVKDSVNRAPAPGPASPAGIAALQAEIGANSARQAEIRAELQRVDEEYTSAALLWDTSQLVSARTEMNAASDTRRALQHELADLTDDAPRLKARLQAAQAAHRREQHEQDLQTIAPIAGEFADLADEYRRACVDLVQLHADLVRLRDSYRVVVRRCSDYCDVTGTPKPPVNLGALAIPIFEDVWLDGAPRSLQAAKLAMGLD